MLPIPKRATFPNQGLAAIESLRHAKTSGAMRRFEAHQNTISRSHSTGRVSKKWMWEIRLQARSTTRAAGKRLIDARERIVKWRLHLQVLSHEVAMMSSRIRRSYRLHNSDRKFESLRAHCSKEVILSASRFESPASCGICSL